MCKVMVGAFVGLMVVSLWALAYAQVQPTSRATTITLCTYSQVAKYDYLAWLRPNNIYGTDVLGPGGGTIYTAIVDTLDLNFSYGFASSPTWTNSTTYQLVTVSMESPGKWSKVLSSSDIQYLLQMSDPFGTSHINVSRVFLLAGQIDLETGVHSSEIDVSIDPLIHTVAQTPVGQIDETFAPAMVVSFLTDSSSGNRIELGNLTQSKSGAITTTQTTNYPDAVNRRFMSYGAATASAVGLVASVGVYVRERPHRKEEPVEKTASQIKDLTAKIEGEPLYDKGGVVVKMATLDDLVKVAAQLGTPVLSGTRPSMQRNRRPVKYFYAIDGLVRYEFITEEPEPQAHVGVG